MRVLVIGDNCIDEFVYGACKRICPEAPVPVFNPIKTVQNRGMAGNVVANLENHIEVDFVTNPEKIIKSRYVDEDSNQMIVRIDANDRCERISREELHAVNYNKYEAIVISDYDKGFLDQEDIRYIASRHPLTFLDTKKKLGDWCESISYIKINEDEYERTKFTISKAVEENLIVTRGGAGCEYRGEIYPVNKVEVKDVSGAGDTFLSALVYNFINSYVIEDAIKFANERASEVIQKRGVNVWT